MSHLDPESEYEALMHVVDRLQARYPHLTSDDLRAMTVEAFESFDSAHVRDFVPVLVERRVAERISATPVT
ncbi:MAG: hypothetical protein DI573_02820 [Microbacterium sp.]|jgi:hypothetical protein|uniref:three-helix bundle dimerization domain-containing protein n=1 Tax=unclassified Microbacterium TaxID=2609290 RepID=UPI000DB6823C|nr:hypothetical protein [Microbacterium sp.]PZU40946.1 MAG: hypothetical protein DI573_02820 [Microbacterium sp.]